MKITLLLLTLSIAVSASASVEKVNSSCKDSNFDETYIYDGGYKRINKYERFSRVNTFYTVTPGQLFESYFDIDLDESPNYSAFCFSVKAHYFTHTASNKEYVMYTTHEDQCDGGNTMGVIVDVAQFKDGKGREAIVAEVRDRAMYCLKK